MIDMDMTKVYDEKFKNLDDRVNAIQTKLDGKETDKILVKLETLYEVGKEEAAKTLVRCDRRDETMGKIADAVNKLTNITESLTAKTLVHDTDISTLKNEFQHADNKTKIDTSLWAKSAFGIVAMALFGMACLLLQKWFKIA